MLLETDIAWAAGLFEGEGCISIRRRYPFYVQLSVISTDLDVLQRFAGIAADIAAGHPIKPVTMTVQATDKHRAQYRWATARRHAVRKILTALNPWFGERRAAKCDDALRWLTFLEE
jgi:hypothetical protein